jgi:DNA-binding transcriptional ArsR family regulator
MPILLGFSKEDLLRCRFALSPLWETAAAARTLVQPERQVHHLPWLRRVQPDLARLDLTLLLALQPRAGYTPDFLSPPPQGPLTDFEHELAQVHTTPLDQVAHELDRCVRERSGGDASPAVLAAARGLAADPAAALERLTELLGRCWAVLLERHWPRLRDLLDADIAFRARRLAEGGLERLLADLHPWVHWRDGTLQVSTYASDRRDLHGEGLVLMPSAFNWPSVSVMLDPPWQPTLIYPARGVAALWQSPAATPPAALARLIGRTRAKLLLTLAEPASTATLARRYGLSPGTVSEHLTAMRDAGLLSASRIRHQVLYERTPLGIALITTTADETG